MDMNLIQLLPDWAPNIHPMVVHFPIGLLVFAIILDLMQWIPRLGDTLGRTTLILYAAGTLGSIAAFWTGRLASETVQVSVQAQTVMSDHDDWALYTTIFFIVFTLIRIGLYFAGRDRGRVLRVMFSVAALAGMGMLWQTGELGKKLVYKHGVGLSAMEVPATEPEFGEESRFESRDDGFVWTAGSRAEGVLLEHIEIIHDSEITDPLHFQVGEDEDKGAYLELKVTAESGPVIILFDVTARDISLEAVAQTDGFEGRFGLVYQYHSPDHYGFMDFDGNQVRMARHENGTDADLVRNDWHGRGWFAMRAVADGRHLHGYIDEDMIVHEHASPWEPGRTGFLLDGAGPVRLRSLHLVRLRGQ
jgi:uncharacterized membrane protein